MIVKMRLHRCIEKKRLLLGFSCFHTIMLIIKFGIGFCINYFYAIYTCGDSAHDIYLHIAFEIILILFSFFVERHKVGVHESYILSHYSAT